MSKLFSPIVHPRSRRARSLQIAVLLILLAIFYLIYGNQYYPIKDWLILSYLKAWIAVTGFVLSCLSAGWWLLKLVLPGSPRLSERILLAFGFGVLAFYLLMYVAGILGLYSTALFYSVPIALFALGAPRLSQDWPRLRQRFPGYLRGLLQPRSTIQVIAAVLGVIALLALYMQVVLPRNTHADSYWYHMPVAEHYIAAGGIVRFNEGWYVGCYPQLVSLLFTWAFLSPGELFAHVVLCEHLDFALFLVTLIGVSGLAARLLETRHFPYAGACVFLFPKLFVYDSNINANADHVLGFWGLLLGIALFRLATHFSIREAVVAGAFAGAAACTKYQACYVIVPAILLVLFLSVRHRSWSPGLVWLSTVALISSTHWLKNVVFYHDPFYPLLHRYLPVTPFHAGAALSMEREYWLPQFAARGPWSDRIWAALKTSLSFSFVPNDWNFHGKRPIFGSLFTLAIPVLFVVGRTKRLLVFFLGTHIGLVVWYLTSHQDRFLQSLVPWMAAGTAAILHLVWKRGTFARIGATTLVVAQAASGLDVYFMRTHMMLADSPIRTATEYFAAAHTGRYATRYIVSPSEEKVGAVLPKDAVLLSHTYQSKLGLGVRMVADGAGWQGAIEYSQHESPTDTAALLKRLGVTHVMRHGDPSVLGPEEAAREIAFQRWLTLYTSRERTYDDVRLAPVLSEPRELALARQPTRVAWIDCGTRPSVAIYTLSGLRRREPLASFALEALQQNTLQQLDTVTAVVRNGSCQLYPELELTIAGQFTRRLNAGAMSIWVRARMAPRRAP